jgi:hypothetical protein
VVFIIEYWKYEIRQRSNIRARHVTFTHIHKHTHTTHTCTHTHTHAHTHTHTHIARQQATQYYAHLLLVVADHIEGTDLIGALICIDMNVLCMRAGL